MTAYELLKDAKRWTKGAVARTKKGKECDWDSDKAAQWCLIGALWKTYGQERMMNDEEGLAHKVMNEICELRPQEFKCIGDFNDGATHKEVLEVLLRAGL